MLISYLIFSSLILAVFHFAERKAWQLRRFDVVDLVIKGHLKKLRGKRFAINFSYTIVKIGFPALLFFMCLIPESIPFRFSLLSIVLFAIILITWFLKKAWIQKSLAFVLYTFIPFIVYFATDYPFSWMQKTETRLFNALFIILVFSIIMTLRFTKRQHGFKVTPMDFLILVIALVVPYIGGAYMYDSNLGYVVAKTIALYFGYEVIIGEMRERLGKLTLATLAALGAVIVRGFLH